MYSDSSMYFSGYQVIEVPCMSDKKQARTHKKKRINKKWKKRYGMKEVPWNKFVVTNDGKIYGHPKMIEMLKTDIAFKEYTL